jgi:pimeloyl-ACP methyl ester carboxylesterase
VAEKVSSRGNRWSGSIKAFLTLSLEIFEAAEGGGHFMFIENPGKFNRRVLQFLSPSLEANQEKQTAELDTLC